MLYTSLPIEELTDILHERLAARKDKNKDEVAALPEPAERPIVNLPGAFVCWHKISGTQFTAWADESGFRYIRQDGRKSGWDVEVAFHDKFTRTPPSPTLPPEYERLVGPIAAYFQVDESEVRKALATCAGG